MQSARFARFLAEWGNFPVPAGSRRRHAAPEQQIDLVVEAPAASQPAIAGVGYERGAAAEGGEPRKMRVDHSALSALIRRQGQLRKQVERNHPVDPPERSERRGQGRGRQILPVAAHVVVAPQLPDDRNEMGTVDEVHALESAGEGRQRHVKQWSRAEHGDAAPPRQLPDLGGDEVAGGLKVRRPSAVLAPAPRPEPDGGDKVPAKPGRRAGQAQRIEQSLEQHGLGAGVTQLQQRSGSVPPMMIFAAITCTMRPHDFGRTQLGRHGFGLAAAVAVLMSLAAGAAACEGLRAGPRGAVGSVTDGDTVVLDSGLVVRLIGTQAPKLPLGREGFAAWPKAETARLALEELVLGRNVIVRYGGETIDRHGRALGHLFLADESELWVQEQMVAQGLARVYSFPDNRACLAELLAAESRARAMRLGIWSDPYYTVRRADRPQQLAEREGHYELVEGRVLTAERVGKRVFLNFGRHWKEDFTVVIEGRALRLFAKEGLDPLVLAGALVRVRGWLEVRDGPRIEVTHPEQLEVLATQ